MIPTWKFVLISVIVALLAGGFVAGGILLGIKHGIKDALGSFEDKEDKNEHH